MDVWKWACRAFVAAALAFGAYTLLSWPATAEPETCRVTERQITTSVRQMARIGMGRWMMLEGETAQQALQSFNDIPPETSLEGDTIYAFELVRPFHLGRGRTVPAGGVLFAVIKGGCRVFAGPISARNWRLILHELNGV